MCRFSRVSHVYSIVANWRYGVHVVVSAAAAAAAHGPPHNPGGNTPADTYVRRPCHGRGGKSSRVAGLAKSDEPDLRPVNKRISRLFV